MVTADGTHVMDGRSNIHRDASNPDDVTVWLLYTRTHINAMSFKVSSYNAAGDSALTTSTLHF